MRSDRYNKSFLQSRYFWWKLQTPMHCAGMIAADDAASCCISDLCGSSSDVKMTQIDWMRATAAVWHIVMASDARLNPMRDIRTPLMQRIIDAVRVAMRWYVAAPLTPPISRHSRKNVYTRLLRLHKTRKHSELSDFRVRGEMCGVTPPIARGGHS